MRAFIALCALAACATPAPDFETDETFIVSPPLLMYADLPQLGTLTFNNDGDLLRMQTLDFSVGAVDPSAWFARANGLPTLTVRGYVPEDGAFTGLNFATLEATFTALSTGASTSAMVEVFAGDTSTPVARNGTPFNVTIATITAAENPNYRRITGSFAGNLCNISVVEGDICVPMTGTFDTLAAFEN